ncbi:peptidylprolyl isomerase [Marinicella sp. W31]|uniref:peptidylprolyl isomerase n=1 Tax=Marinicella sp. W31 TaxID=3023713 RepID=UPI0037578415
MTGTRLIIWFISVSLAAAGGWYFGQQQKASPQVEATGEVLAVVNDRSIDKDWFVEQMKLRGGLKSGQYHTVEQRQALLDFLINQEVVFAAAQAQGIDEDPAVDRLYKKAVIDRFLEQQLNPKLEAIKVSNAELQNYFDRHQEKYSRPARRRAAIIHVAVSTKADDAMRQQKRARIEEAIQHMDQLEADVMHFGELAKTYSDDRASRYQGGVIGWLINHASRDYRWGRQVTEALFALEKNGDVSPIIETEAGFYVVRLVSAEQVQQKQFEQVQKGIRSRLLQEKRKQARTEFLATFKTQADISINHEMLAAIAPLSAEKTDSNKQPPALPGTAGGQ